MPTQSARTGTHADACQTYNSSFCPVPRVRGCLPERPWLCDTAARAHDRCPCWGKFRDFARYLIPDLLPLQPPIGIFRMITFRRSSPIWMGRTLRSTGLPTGPSGSAAGSSGPCCSFSPNCQSHWASSSASSGALSRKMSAVSRTQKRGLLATTPRVVRTARTSKARWSLR